MRILLLDDDGDLRDVLGALLADLGHEVLALASYAELVAHGPDVIGCGLALLDVNLGPRAPNGLDACAWLLEQGFTGRIVFLSGHTRARLALSFGIGEAIEPVRVLEKPVSVGELERLVAEASP